MSDTTHFVKARHADDKTFRFMASGGRTTRLKIHALRFTEENAIAFINENAPDNPDWEFKAAPIHRKTRSKSQ
jgi:hypothetical protein